MVKALYILVVILAVVSSVCAQGYSEENDFVTTKSGLKYKITKQGKGECPKAGDRVWVHFIGKLTNDSIFDNTLETGSRNFYLGQGQLIKAWEEGLKLIKPGGAIVLIVPPKLGYGAKEYNGVKPNSILIYEISLIQVDRGETIKPFKTNGLELVKSKSKFKYYVVEKGQGKQVNKGDNAYVHYTGFLNDGSIFDSSHKKGKAVRITVGGGQVFKGWDMGLELMTEGSKFRFVFPAKLAYGKKGFKNIVPPNATITMDIELIEITPEIHVAKWNATEKDTIETESGLKYIVFNEGVGEFINTDEVVEVHYSGYFLNGDLFDSSVKREEPIKFPVGAGVVIDGWDEGVKLMKKSAKFQFIIPAHLAYGEDGAPPQIPSDTPLIFDIEVVSIMK